MNMNSLQEISDCIRRGKKAVICGHTMPDGDSVGSVLAMRLLLKEIGMEAYLGTPDPIPRSYDFLPGAEDFKPPGSLPADCDLAVVLDCTDLNRLGDQLGALISQIPNVVNVDHHISNQFFGNCNYVDDHAAATGEIVFELIKLMGVPLSREMATNLYTAIVMDTGSFMFDNTTDKTHEIAAELIRTGLDISHINKSLFERKELAHIKILGYAMANLKTADEGRVAWVAIPLTVMQELNANDEHADGVINYPRMLEGVEVGMLLRELTPGKFKVGFRSTKRVDVNRLAASFGGGGHPRASGCVVEGTLEEVEKQVVDLCIEAINKSAEL